MQSREDKLPDLMLPCRQRFGEIVSAVAIVTTQSDLAPVQQYALNLEGSDRVTDSPQASEVQQSTTAQI